MWIAVALALAVVTKDVLVAVSENEDECFVDFYDVSLIPQPSINSKSPLATFETTSISYVDRDTWHNPPAPVRIFVTALETLCEVVVRLMPSDSVEEFADDRQPWEGRRSTLSMRSEIIVSEVQNR